MALFGTDESEIVSIIMNLKQDCAVRWYQISVKLVKDCKHVLVWILNNVFNLCIAEGVFLTIF